VSLKMTVLCRQAAALLQLVNAMAGGRDVGTAVTITCQTVIKGDGGMPVSPTVKRLAYNIVRGGALTDADWDNVLAGFQNDVSPSCPSTEVGPQLETSRQAGQRGHLLKEVNEVA
jgi:hypothetical protein